MAVAFDNTVASVLFNKKARIPNEPGTDQPIVCARARIEHLVRELQKSKDRIVMATPVIAELLTVTGPDGIEYFNTIARSKVFETGDFDSKAALELSFLNNIAFAEGDKKNGIDAPWQKIKVDRQIVAICKVKGVHTLYTDDSSLAKSAVIAGIKPIALHELPFPPTSAQGDFLSELEQEPAEDEADGRPENTG